jgi:ABC-type multidrug transport system fused ATPase/permease subunit
LISRLYDVTDGKLPLTIRSSLLNLNDLSEIDRSSRCFSVFRSIKNNIKFGKEDATDEEVIAAKVQ